MTGTNTYDYTDLQYVIPEIWSKKVNELFKAKLIVAPLVLDLSSDVANGGKTVHIPDLYSNIFTASDKENASEVTLQSPATENDDLTVDTWKEVSFLIEDKEALQVLRSYGMQKRYMDMAAYTIAKAYDTATLALYSGLTNSVGASNTDIADSDIRQAIQYLDENDIPAEDRAFIFHPTVLWGQVMGIDKYTEAYKAGGEGSIRNGELGRLYGIPVLQTTQIPYETNDYHNMLVQKEAFATAKLQDIRTQANYIPENLGTLITCDIIYGTLLNRALAGVEITSGS